MNKDINFAMYVALTELAKISQALHEIRLRDYDDELAEFTGVIDDRIDFIFTVAQEESPTAFKKYIEHMSDVIDHEAKKTLTNIEEHTA
jgi:hypothetical protein